MLSPDGAIGDVPLNQVEAAKKSGFKVGMDMISPNGTLGTIPADKYQAAMGKGFQPKTAVDSGSQPQQPSTEDKGFLHGVYENTLGPLVGLGKDMEDYYSKKGLVSQALESAGGPVAMIADALTDSNHPLHKLGAGLLQSALDQARATYDSTKDAASADAAALKALVHGDWSQANAQAGQGASSGLEAVGHGIATVLPGVGPAAVKAGEDIGQGKTGEGLGEATGLIGAVLSPEIKGTVSDAASALRESIGNRFPSVKPVTAVEKLAAATLPKVGAGNFLQSAERALPELEKIAGITAAPRDLAGVVKLTAETGKQLEAQFQSVLDPVKATAVDASPIADAMESKITKYLLEKSPDVADKIKEDAGFYLNKDMSLADLDEFRQSVNNELKTYYKKNNLSRSDAH